VSWVYNEKYEESYLADDPRGWANVSKMPDGRWQWEGHSDSFLARMTMDGNWGVCPSREAAQKEAEDYLTEYGGPA
jgi:hypothetical protein